MAHTPGPWMLDGWDIVQRDCNDSCPALAFVGNAKRTLAMEEINANARLISAAPELLAALKQAVSLLSYAANGGGIYGCNADEWHAMEPAARAAIAKAEWRDE